MRTCTTAALLLALAASSPVLAAQTPAPSGTALVVDIPGDGLYHQPGCPLVRKAGTAVKVMKQAEATRRGMKPHDCASADPNAPQGNPNLVPVHVQADDKRYHKADCRLVKPGAKSITLDEAGRKYWPCPVCKPPIRKRVQSGGTTG